MVVKRPKVRLVNSIFVPFTRPRLVDDFLEMLSLAQIDLPPTTELVFFNDTDNQQLNDRLLAYLKGSRFGGYKLYMTGEPPLDEAGDRNHADKRRERIIRMRFKAQELVGDSEYLFLLEDDTFFEPHALMRLKSYLVQSHLVGIASGVETGRWAFKHIGAWYIKPIENPDRVQSLPYKEHGTSFVDGTGMYCLATRTELYRQASFRNEAEPLGPDVCYGLDLRRKGFDVLVDWDVPCEHRSIFGTYLAKDATQVVTFQKHPEGWAANLSK